MVSSAGQMLTGSYAGAGFARNGTEKYLSDVELSVLVLELLLK